MSPIYVPGKVVLAKTYVEGDRYFSNVSLLLHGNGTNGSTTITDNSPAPKTVTAVGNAQISTAQSKFPGGSSIAFDGNGDYLSTATGSDFVIGFSDFTIEFWAWKSANGANSYDGVVSSDVTSGTTPFPGSATNGFTVELSAARGFIFIANDTALASYNFNPNDSTWRHYAVARSGNQLRLFTDGMLRATQTNSTNLNANYSIRVGSYGALSGATAFWFNGYIDDLRVTKGIARYTSNFDPPTAPFADAQY